MDPPSISTVVSAITNTSPGTDTLTASSAGPTGNVQTSMSGGRGGPPRGVSLYGCTVM
ncbi:hypothetical protein TWF730_010601 [Orbilia blumenaviensis]|uniref:Uncharacterized protein n=1 Tax=Orbilia blumenaviensis TaxID=1796055 RepID=A0AAV9UNN5_9PEZI